MANEATNPHEPARSHLAPFRLLNEEQAAAYLGVSRALLRKQRLYGSTPRSKAIPFIRIGGRGIRYAVDDLNSWIEESRVRR